MTRTKFRQLWLLVVGTMMLATSYAYNNFKDTGRLIDLKMKERDRLQVELRTGSQMTSALDELDGVTLNEAKSTRLDVLRYLELESSEFQVTTEQPVKRQIVGSDVFVRQFKIEGELPYSKALNQADFFHNLQKVNVKKVKLTPAKGYGDNVILELKGAIYGLQK